MHKIPTNIIFQMLMGILLYVTLAGLQPATYALGERRSMLLSYKADS